MVRQKQNTDDGQSLIKIREALLLTRTQEIRITVAGRRLVERISGRFGFLKQHRVLDAQKQPAEKHMRVLGIGFDSHCVHQNVDQPRLQLLKCDQP